MIKELMIKYDEKELLEKLNELHAHDLAVDFLGLSLAERELIYKILPEERISEVITYLDADDAAIILLEMDIEKQKRMFEYMEPDDATEIIRELEREEKENLIARLDMEEKEDFLTLLSYEEKETGSRMTNLFLTVKPDTDVKDATKELVKNAPFVETINTVFVVDENHILIGAVPFKKLIKTKSPNLIESIVEKYPFVYDKDDIEETVKKIRNYGLYEIAVCDYTNKLLGIVTVDDAFDIYQKESQKDFEKMAALPETEVNGHPFKAAMHRVPWLIILLVLSIPIAFVTTLFEEIIMIVAILAIFQPLILDAAGDVATQTLAVTLRNLSNESDNKSIKKNAIKEITTGMINGFFMGFVAAIITIIIANITPGYGDRAIRLSLVVGLSLWITVFLAPILGVLIPVTLKKMKFDPAVASGPFITTLIDILALVIYFGLATLLLGGL